MFNEVKNCFVFCVLVCFSNGLETIMISEETQRSWLKSRNNSNKWHATATRTHEMLQILWWCKYIIFIFSHHKNFLFLHFKHSWITFAICLWYRVSRIYPNDYFWVILDLLDARERLISTFWWAILHFLGFFLAYAPSTDF